MLSDRTLEQMMEDAQEAVADHDAGMYARPSDDESARGRSGVSDALWLLVFGTATAFLGWMVGAHGLGCRKCRVAARHQGKP